MKRFNYKSLFVILTFGVLVVLSFVPRSVEIFNKNYLFGFDQGRDYLAVKNIVVDHKLTLIGPELGAGSAGIGGLFHGPGYYYSLALPFLLFNGDPYGGMILMFLFSIATIVVTFYLGKRMFGVLGGLVIALLVSISPPLIAQARFIWNSHPIGFFIALAFYFIYQIPKNKYRYLFLSAFVTGFIYHYEMADAVPMSIALVLYVIFILRYKNIKSYLFLILGFFLAYLPMFLFEMRHQFMGSRGLVQYLSGGGDSFNLNDKILLLQKHIPAFWYNALNSFPSQPIWLTVSIYVLIISALSIFLYKEKNKQIKKFVFYLLLLLPVNFLVFLNLKNSIWDYYLVDLNIVYVLLFAYSLFASIKNKNNILKNSLLITFFVTLSFGLISAFKTFIYDYSDYGGVAKIKGKMAAIDFIYGDAKGKEFGFMAFTPPIYTYDTEYLLWWYGEQKYGYQPYSEKRGEFYLLIEPDFHKPWSYKGWLETVVKSGDVIFTKELPSGYIVQKRIENEE